jgi:hypothetical protein
LFRELPGGAALIGGDLVRATMVRFQTTLHPIGRRRLPSSAIEGSHVPSQQGRDQEQRAESPHHLERIIRRVEPAVKLNILAAAGPAPARR